MASVEIQNAGHTGTSLVINLDDRNRLVINARAWARGDSRLKGLPPNRHMWLWDLWVLWERRSSPRRHWENIGLGDTIWVGQGTLDLRTFTLGPLIQYEEEEQPQHVDSQVRLTDGG